MQLAEMADALAAARVFAHEGMKGYDASHDWSHVERVTRMALLLAKEERVEDLLVVELSALLHDVGDAKYNKSEVSGSEQVRAFLRGQPSLSEETITKVVDTVANVSFSKEKKAIARGEAIPTPSPELAVVQDADRLDAIGAIGIARTFTFGGARDRAIYGTPDSSVQHFYDKLLAIRSMLKTDAGRREAERRHAFMETFLDQLHGECGTTPPGDAFEPSPKRRKNQDPK